MNLYMGLEMDAAMETNHETINDHMYLTGQYFKSDINELKCRVPYLSKTLQSRYSKLIHQYHKIIYGYTNTGG